MLKQLATLFLLVPHTAYRVRSNTNFHIHLPMPFSSIYASQITTKEERNHRNWALHNIAICVGEISSRDHSKGSQGLHLTGNLDGELYTASNIAYEIHIQNTRPVYQEQKYINYTYIIFC